MLQKQVIICIKTRHLSFNGKRKVKAMFLYNKKTGHAKKLQRLQHKKNIKSLKCLKISFNLEIKSNNSLTCCRKNNWNTFLKERLSNKVYLVEI
jgi:hypothetical protein